MDEWIKTFHTRTHAHTLIYMKKNIYTQWNILRPLKKRKSSFCDNLDRTWEHSGKWNNSKTNTNTAWCHFCELSEQLCSLKQSEVGAGAVGWGRWGKVGQRYKLPVWRWVSSGDLIASMVARVNSSIFHGWSWLREQIPSVLTTHSKKVTMGRVDVLINLIMCLWYIHTMCKLRHHVIRLKNSPRATKCIQFLFVYHTTIKLEKKGKV